MSTGIEQSDISHVTFGNIDRHVMAFDAAAFTSQGAVQGLDNQIQRLNIVYAAVRPIILGVTAISLLPAAWRSALRILVTTADEVTATFKAGKDLAIGGVTAEMEPKLPVG